MASEDVIELGSSDDEAEPESKKIKPIPNAMVHIPRGVTIKPAKFNLSSIPKQLAGIGKNVTITSISKGNNIVSNPFAVKSKTSPQIASQKGPLDALKRNNSQLLINKLPKLPIASKVLNKPIKVHSPRTINSLPPSITVRRTTGNITNKRPGAPGTVVPVPKKQKVTKLPSTAVLTVELDDDEPPSNASPQWYLRPEDQRASSKEEENNKEPEKPQYVEITIEDSPVKPAPQNKQKSKFDASCAVTIDDSPVKVLENKTDSGSDVEANTCQQKVKVPHSKKKLEYAKETKSAGGTIEIEIPAIAEGAMNFESVDNKNNTDVIEIEESPLKVDNQETIAPKKAQCKFQLETTKPEVALQENDDSMSDFHPVYRDFIQICFQLENSDDMKKIVEKKIKTYYRQVPKEYTESEEFIDMVSSKIVAMKAGPQKMYLYIKDIVDELNMQRKVAKSEILSNITKQQSESNNFLYGEDSEFDSKRQRQIRKLEKTLKKLHRAIQKLEMQEVDFDDEEDSVYLLTESDEDSTSDKDSDKQLEKDPNALLQRYKERMVRVHAKFCQLTNTRMPSEPRVQIEARPGQPSGPAKRLEKWINKKVPLGTPIPFPDFHDVLRCVRDANAEDKLGWNEADVMEEARDLFTRCGKKLQRRRQENEWRIAASKITSDSVDPAEQNEELKKQLDENTKLASKKESEVFNKFADRQSLLKLEAQEIGDKEADESPVESEEDESNDESSLENKEKRKERLIRLLQEKSRKTVKEKENEVKMSVEDTEGENDIVKKKIKTDVNSKEKENKVPGSNEEQVNNTIKEIQNVKLLTEEQGNSTNNIEKTEEENNLTDTKEKDNSKIVNINEKQLFANDDEKILSLSDDSNKLESDVDELHLLQKLHSESEMNSSALDSSDCGTLIISDTLGSSGENKQASDVISIENSSFSESETNTYVIEPKESQTPNLPDKTHNILGDTETKCLVQEKVTRSSNEEYNEPIEDILLASSEDEEPITDNENLKYDIISIGETVVEGVDKVNNPNGGDCAENQKKICSIDSESIVSKTANTCSDNVEDKAQEKIKKSELTDEVSSSSVKSVANVSDEEIPAAVKKVDNQNAKELLKNTEQSDTNVVDLENNKLVNLKVTSLVMDKMTEEPTHAIDSNQSLT